MQDTRAPSSRAGSYFEEIRRFPMLKAGEEYMLAVRWRERGYGSAAHQLLTSRLRLVAKIAIAYRRYGLPTSDLISEGNIGLLQAIKRFDPDKGIRFSTYAIWWVKATIKDYIVRSWSLVKMGTTANQKQLFFNLPKAKRRLSALQDVVEMNRRRAFKKVQTAAHAASERMTAIAAKALWVRPSLSGRVQCGNASSKLLGFQISILLAASMVAGPAAAGATAVHRGGASMGLQQAAGGWRGAASGALQGGWQRGWRSGWHGGQNWNGGAGWNRGWDRASFGGDCG